MEYLLIKRLKIFIRQLQEFLDRNIFGSFIQKFIWRWKHIYVKDWTKTSLGSIDLAHRDQLTSVIASCNNVQSVLEIGCASAPNLRLLREKLPSVQLSGIDINKKAIRTAHDYFRSVNDDKVNLIAKAADQLDDFQDKSFDVVFSQAVMIYISPPNISKVIEEMLRLSSNLVVFNEYHLDGADEGFFDNGRWVYDYYTIIRRNYPEATISMQKTDFKGGSWDLYGKLITVKL